MEYDPASPTDEVEDCSTELDLAAIPLPESAVIAPAIKNVIDIPLPPQDFMAADIPLPPPAPPVPAADHQVPLATSIEPETPDHIDADNAPLKFSIRLPSKPIGQENFGESSGVFESTKDSKTEEPRSMPKLQALMKRSKPSQLPVGVLPSKLKLPAAETKTELFLPSKESDVNGALSNTGDSIKITVNNMPNLNLANMHSGLSAASMDYNGLSSKDVLNYSSTITITAPDISTASSTGFTGVTASNLTVASTAAHIPNLMSLTVQPVQTLSLGQPANTLADPTAVLRQTKMTLANMQYVNPQKLRSAQMIATPLIANPAIAAQPHHEDHSKSRDSRRRSRSRSRRSRSGRRSSTSRGRRRRSSSSSDSSPPRRSPRRYQRRSRSRRGSVDRYQRNSTYSRTRIPDRRDYDRRRDRLSETESRRNHRDSKLEKRPRSPTPKDRKHTRRRSSSHDRSNKAKFAKRSPDRRGSHVDKSDSRIQEVHKSSTRKKYSPSPKRKSESSANRKNPDASSKKSTVSKKDNNVNQPKKSEERRRPASQSSDTGSPSSNSSSSSDESSHETNERSNSKHVSPPSKRQKTPRESGSANDGSNTSSPTSGCSERDLLETRSRNKDLSSGEKGTITTAPAAVPDIGKA